MKLIGELKPNKLMQDFLAGDLCVRKNIFESYYVCSFKHASLAVVCATGPPFELS